MSSSPRDMTVSAAPAVQHFGKGGGMVNQTCHPAGRSRGTKNTSRATVHARVCD